MSLFLATLLVGALALGVGLALAADTPLIRAGLRSFPRSQRAAFVLFGGSAVWFLSRVIELSPADFGQYRIQLFIGFAVVAVLAFFYLDDFLAVRGLAALLLLAAGPILDAAFGQYDTPSRLVLVTFVYLCLIFALIVGAQPWRLRDAIEWLQAVRPRTRILGLSLATYGLLLFGVAFSY